MSDRGPLSPGDPVARGMSDPSGSVLSRRFTAETVTAVRHAVARYVAAAGLTGDEAEDFVLAVHELVSNAVRHGGGSGQVTVRMDADVLTCEVSDNGGDNGGGGRLPVQLPHADVPGGRGLWLAHQLTGALMLTRRPGGVTATVSVCVTPQAAAGSEPSPRTATEDGQR